MCVRSYIYTYIYIVSDTYMLIYRNVYIYAYISVTLRIFALWRTV